MLRIIIIWIGTYAAYNTDLETDNFFQATLFPIVNIFYILFLLQNFIGFLYALRAHSSGKKDVDPIDFLFDVLNTLYSEISYKYSGKFDFAGRFAEPIEDLVVPLEILCVVVSFYEDLQLLAYLAD